MLMSVQTVAVPEETMVSIANHFAEEYNAWTKLVIGTPPGAVNYQAMRQWEKVRGSFKDLDVYVRNVR